MKEHMEMLSRKTHDEFISYQIKNEYEDIMKRILGGSIYGKKIGKDSPVEVLIVAAYYAGVFGVPHIDDAKRYIKDN